MLDVLANRTYRHLFLAQIIALVGTGLTTIAPGQLAYEIAGPNAGSVLGTALAIKMVAYVGIAPAVGAFANRPPQSRAVERSGSISRRRSAAFPSTCAAC